MLTIVSATTYDERDFHQLTFLGRSLTRLRKLDVQIDLRVAFRNRRKIGLSELYNHAICEDRSRQAMIFIHDDVSIEDMLVEQKLSFALKHFDVVGVAGAVSPHDALVWFNPGWQPSGCVGHADREHFDSVLRPELTYYGPSPAECTAIDGLFMAVVPDVVYRARARFDAEFTYHHYDLAFCRSAREARLRIGTWPIWVVHGSGGGYDKSAWADSAQRYATKYLNRQ